MPTANHVTPLLHSCPARRPAAGLVDRIRAADRTSCPSPMAKRAFGVGRARSSGSSWRCGGGGTRPQQPIVLSAAALTRRGAHCAHILYARAVRQICAARASQSAQHRDNLLHILPLPIWSPQLLWGHRARPSVCSRFSLAGAKERMQNSFDLGAFSHICACVCIYVFVCLCVLSRDALILNSLHSTFTPSNSHNSNQMNAQCNFCFTFPLVSS